MGGERRVELAMRMSEEARAVSRDGIRDRHPDDSAHEVEMALRRLLLGDDLVRAAWPDEPLVAP